MIDLSWSHILIILVVALIVVGPKDLPRLMHTIGRWMAKARAMADQFKKSFDEMSRQAELDELRNEIDALRRERPFAGLDQTLGSPVLPLDAAPQPETRVAQAEPAGPGDAEREEAVSPAPIAPGAEPPPP